MATTSAPFAGVCGRLASLLNGIVAVTGDEDDFGNSEAVIVTAETDPLVDLVHRYPEDGLRFLKMVMFLGALSAVAIAIPSGVFLSANWAVCGLCARPIHFWLIIHCIMQLLQAPVRVAFLQALWHVRRSSDGNWTQLQECVLTFTSSFWWRSSKTVSMVNYGWMVLGVVWLLNSDYCKPCPGLYSLCTFVMAIAVARVLLSVVIYRLCFLSHLRTEGENARRKPRGATQELIDALPLVVVSKDAHGNDGFESGCAVCLCEFEHGDELRRLPCGHRFHATCADTWLRRNRKCPLCNHGIDVPLPTLLRGNRHVCKEKVM
jgi:hypothetical protein